MSGSTVESSTETQPMQVPRKSFFARTFVVDKRVQYTFLIYILLVSSLFSAFDTTVSVIWHFAVSSQISSKFPLGPILSPVLAIISVGLIVLGIAIFGAHYISNKVAGPIWRMEQHMRDILDRKVSGKLAFRDGDQFPEICEVYGRLIDRLEELEKKHGGSN